MTHQLDEKTAAHVKKALKHLDHATPQQRNGPTYQAANTLRELVDLPPMPIGGKPSDGAFDTTEENCPGHVASAADQKVCRLCGIHIDSLRPPEDEPEDDFDYAQHHRYR